MKVDIYNLKNQKTGTQEVSDKIFDAPWKPAIVHQVLVTQHANRRRPWAHVKDRSEVSGGGRKPWRQKGTGRARHGSIRSPIWSGGGKAHGPTSERIYSKKINRKAKRSALFSVLSKKLQDNELRFFETITFSAPKTKEAATVLKEMKGDTSKTKKMDVMLVTFPGEESTLVTRAARNLVKVKVLPADSLNIDDILSYKEVFVDSRAIPVIEDTFTSNSENVVRSEQKANKKEKATIS